MVRSVFELADLAKEFEIASNMKWVTFDLSMVLMIEERLQTSDLYRRPKSFASSRHSSSPDDNADNQNADELNDGVSPHDTTSRPKGDSEEEINLADDQRHCIEAWRKALLIYIRRVFKTHAHLNGRHNGSTTHWSRNSSKTSFFSLVRSAINDIRCVRRSSQTQKQLLLPAFIAGSETSDPELRRFICTYCDWWSNKSNYKMFDTVSKLLVEIWDEIDKPTTPAAAGVPPIPQSPPLGATPFGFSQSTDKLKGKKNSCWWGSVIDHNAKVLSTDKPVQYLFG